jgi:hypothetical protein
MAKKDVKAPAKKKTHTAGSILDFIGWGVREVALPVPDSLIDAMKKKKKVKKLKK